MHLLETCVGSNPFLPILSISCPFACHLMLGILYVLLSVNVVSLVRWRKSIRNMCQSWRVVRWTGADALCATGHSIATVRLPILFLR